MASVSCGMERVSLPMGAKLLDRTIASRISAPSAKSRACPGKDQLPQERRCAVVFQVEASPTPRASKLSRNPESMTRQLKARCAGALVVAPVCRAC